MPRVTLDKKIRQLLDHILIFESMVESATLEAIEALKKRDLDLAQFVYNSDASINAIRFDIENNCLVTIATQQPIMAHDLRLLASILEVTGEIERMGDYAKGIAHITLMMSNLSPLKIHSDIPKMAKIATDMLHRAAGAFVNEDAELARQIPFEDDQVDLLYNQVCQELIGAMVSNPSTIDRANYQMWAAHNLERMADRVTNICERTIYVATGRMREYENPHEYHVSFG